jgi:hypothetical protein
VSSGCSKCVLSGTVRSGIVIGVNHLSIHSLGGLNSAKKLHDEMLVRVFHAHMAFFDTTPVGMNIRRGRD